MTKRLQYYMQHINKMPLPIRYGLLLGIVLILLKTLEYSVFSYRLRQDIFLGITSIAFLILGVGIAFIWFKRSSVSPSPLVLTAKEHTLLRGLKHGLTNQQLADASFVSVNTVKTQLKTLYKKLEISNRSQAVQKAQYMSLL